MHASSVSELLYRCTHDDDAWQDFDRRFGKRLELLMETMLRRFGLRAQEEDVEELVQDLYLRVLRVCRRAPACFRGRCPEEVWSYFVVVARHLVSNRVRDASRHKRNPVMHCPLAAQMAGVVSGERSPEERIFSNQLLRLFLARCRRELRGIHVRRQLIVLRLACVEGWSSREIAHHLDGVTPQAVDSLVRRMRQSFIAQGLRLPRRRHYGTGQAAPSAAAIAAVAGW